MGTLRYAVTMSLDGFAADEEDGLQWSVPDAEVFDVHVERLAGVTTEVLGRKTYRLMDYWEHYDEVDGSEAEYEFARHWVNIEKVAVSTTMSSEELSSARSRLVPDFTLRDLEDIVAETDGIVEIFGPTTAAEAIRAGMVDEFEFFIVPVMIGAGLKALPDGVRLDLKRVEQRMFKNGVVYMRYETKTRASDELR